MAATEYTLADGTQTCGVTTVLDEWKETAFGTYRSEAIEKAREVGHQLHALIHRANEATLSKTTAVAPPLHPETMPEVATGVASWMAWCAERRPIIVASEQPVTSEKWRIGGTPDCKAWVDGELWMIDWKPMRTGTAAYMQLTAYAEMEREVRPLDATDNLMVVNLSRDPAVGPKFDDRRRWEKNPADVRIFQSLIDLRQAREGLRARHKAALRREG